MQLGIGASPIIFHVAETYLVLMPWSAQTQQIDRVVEVVEEALQGRVVRHLGQRRQDGKRKGGLGSWH